MIKLGDKVTDSISGFSGVVTGKAQYLYGCEQACVTSHQLQDGAPVDSLWFDEQRLDPKSTAPVGGPMPTPPARSHPPT